MANIAGYRAVIEAARFGSQPSGEVGLRRVVGRWAAEPV
jgi:hypothetical protein